MSSAEVDDDVQIIEFEQDNTRTAKHHTVHRFFTFNAENGVEEGTKFNHCSQNRSGTSVCNVIGCGFSIEGKNVRDLIHHLKMNHTFKEYDQFLYLSGERETHTRNLPRAKQNSTLINSFFKFNAKYRVSQCTVSGCEVSSISGKHSTQLTRHLKKYHPNEYLEYLKIQNMKKESQLPSSTCVEKISPKIDNSLMSTQFTVGENSMGNCDSEESLIGLKRTLPTGNEKIRSDFEELNIDVNLGLTATVLPETQPLGSPLTAILSQVLSGSPKIIPSSSNCTEIEELTLPALLSPPMNETFLVDTPSYTNLRLLPASSLAPVGGTLSAEPFSVEIDLPKADQEQQSSNEILLKAMTDIVDIIKLEPTLPESNMILCEMPALIPIQKYNEMISQHFPIKIEDDLLGSSTKVVLPPETKLLLSEQMRKHVQLLTQMHLIIAQQSPLSPMRDECRSMLLDLVPFKQRMDIANLDEALDLIAHWEIVISRTEPEELCQNQSPNGVTFDGETPHPYPFNSKLMKTMGESRVFIYPELLPDLAIWKTEPETDQCRFSPYEDQLIAMGIEQFTPFCTNLSIDWWYSLDYLVSSMISKHMLPQWTAEKIQNRIENNCLDTSPANPVKYCLENKVAPLLEHVIRPFHSTRKLRNVPPSLLPDGWRELFANRVPSLVQPPVKELICIASIASFSGTSPLVKVFPAKIVNRWKFRSVPGRSFSPSQIPSLPTLPTLFDSLYQQPPSTIPLYHQRHKPICKRRRFLQDFSTEAAQSQSPKLQ